MKRNNPYPVGTPFWKYRTEKDEEEHMSVNSDWDKLNVEQQISVQELRRRIGDILVVETESFYREYPELQLTWSFTLDALIRGNHDTLEAKKP